MNWTSQICALPVIQIDSASILSIVLGSGFVSGLVSVLIIERLKSTWKLESDRTIETLKGEILHNNTLVSSLVSQSGLVKQKIIEKQIESVDLLWKCTLHVKSNTPALISTVNNILTHKEVASGALEHRRGGSSFEEDILKIDRVEYFNNNFDNLQKVQSLRPFIGSKLFILFNAYNATVGRMVHLLTEGVAKDSIVTWNVDTGIAQILRTVLNESEVGFLINGNGINGFNTVVDLMEQKIKNEIDILLSGKSLVADAISISDKIGAISKLRQEQDRNEIMGKD